MSTIRDPAVITTAGRQMMTAGGDISYTKAVLFGQDISHLTQEQLVSLTSIGNPLMTVPVGISDKNNAGANTTVVLEATFQNTDLKADLPYTAVGFFAKRGDGEEKLVILGVANSGAYLAATSPDGVASDALDVKVAIAIGDATSVTAVVDPAGSVTPATLNGAINKVTHDLTAKIDVKADQDAIEKSLATKADQLSLDETNAEVAKKADNEDVTKQLATKANVSDVDDALSKKDDTADVDQKIATVNKSVSDLSYTVSANKTATDASLATKANASDVADNVKTLQANIDTKADKATVDAEIAKIDFAPYAKSADVANELQNYTTTVDLNKLLAGKEDAGTSYSKAELDKKLLALSTDTDGKINADQVSSMIANKVDKSDLASDLKAVNDSIATKANSSDVDLALAKKDDVTDVDAKIKTVTDLANTKANSSDVYTKSAVDTAFSQRDSNITKAQNEVDQLKGRRTVDSADFNSLTDGGTYYISSPAKNAPVSQWGNLFVSNGNGHRVSQVYFPDDGNAPWYRVLDEQDWRGWAQLGTKSDANNAANLANSASSKVDTVLTNSYVRKQGINQNGDLVEIKHAGVKQDNGGYAFDMWSDDWTASKLKDVLGQLPSKANTADVNNALNSKANTGDVTALQGKVNVTTPLFREISADSTWEDIFGVTNPNNVLTSLRINPGGSGQLVNDFAAGIGFGGDDTKAVITVDYGSHVARFTAGNGTAPGWSEDVAWKSDINSTNQTVSALQQTIKTLNDTLSSANATIKTLQDTITGLQTQVNNQANEISYIKANYIEGKRFAKADESQATAWEKENSQRIAFITDN